MKLFPSLLLCVGICSADPLPTVTELITYSGSGSAQASDSFSLVGNMVSAGISGQASTFPAPGGGQAQANITLQGEFLAAGTGTGFLNYTASGSADGSGGAFNASYLLAGQGQSCVPGCGGPPNSVALALGVPFGLTLTGSAYAFSGFFPEDAAYNVEINFDVTDANGQVLTLTEIPIPVPEPGTAMLAAVGLAVGLLSWHNTKYKNSR